MESRGVSPVIGAILLVAITVILAASIAVFTLDIVDDQNEAAPIVADSTATYETGGMSCEDDIVRLSHAAGDTVDLSKTYTIVRLPNSGGKEATITGFPTDGTSLDSDDYNDPDNILNDNCVRGEAAKGDEGTGEWASGTSFSFKINSGSTTGDINPGDRIGVIVVHEPSDTIIVEHSIEVQD